MTQTFNNHETARRSFVRLYNGNKTELQHDFDGNTYRFPPKGVLDVFGYVSRRPDQTGNEGQFRITPDDIAEHFVGNDGVSGHLGPRGLRVLTGHEEADVRAIADAEQVAREKEYHDDRKTIAAYRDAVRLAEKESLAAPLASKNVREAMQRMEQYERENAVLAPYPCDRCGAQCFSAHELEIHQQTQRCLASAPAAVSNNTEVAELKAQVAQLMQLVTASITANAPKKRGPKPKEASA